MKEKRSAISRRLFNRGYVYMLKYAGAHPDLQIREDYRTESGFMLGKWLKVIRSYWKKGRLSSDQVHRLQNMGIAKDADAQNWESMFFYAKEYATHNGKHMDLLYKNDDGILLGAWVERQIRYPYRLSEEQAERLKNIGLEIL